MAFFREIHDNTLITGFPFVAALVLVGLFLAGTAGCDSVSETGGGGVPGTEDAWLIQLSEVIDGGPGKDGIPSVDDPKFAPAATTNYVQDDRLVVGIRVGNVVRAYPHQVLDWHEIVNDVVAGEPIALTYCPLTGTGIAWEREIGGKVTEFGVSGLLFRNNLIPYDRYSGSNWSQMQQRSVNGLRTGLSVQTIPVVETTWSTWQAMYPESDVLTRKTGFQRRYESFTYGRSYLTDDNYIIFPIRNSSRRLSNKERVHGILPDGPTDEALSPRVYVISRFGTGVNMIEDELGGRDYIVVGSSDKNFAVAFERKLVDGSRPSFTPVQNALPVILRDDEGNHWDVFGKAVEGPRKGESLTPARSYTGYWFGWSDFFPNVQIYGQ